MSNHDFDITIIGGGAAGFFAAIQAAATAGKKRVVILEKSNKLLSKVKVSGGGRCNVTHNCDIPSRLIAYYPRGGKSLRKGFNEFGPAETRAWFEKRGIPLKTEDDGRVFPITDNSQSIIDCLLRETAKHKIEIRLRTEVTELKPQNGGFLLTVREGKSIKSEKVIITTGGHNKATAYRWLEATGLKISRPLPSLFTFNVPDSDLKDLMGLSVEKGMVQVPGSKWKQEGPILITHWGFSAPAVIKLSAWAAIDFFERSYQFPILLNWTGKDEEEVRQMLYDFKDTHPKKVVSTNQLFEIPSRLWQKICEKAGVFPAQRYLELPKKKLNKLIEMLVRSPYSVIGKTTFKEEFVTCGGVELSEVNLSTFEAKNIPGLFLAGEVLNVDGLTGGFNFQHAWTSGYLAGRAAAQP